MVYIEVPVSAGTTRLVLDELRLVSPDAATVTVPFKVESLDSGIISGKQILLASEAVPPGRYESLHLDFGKISGAVGVAEVSPGVPPDGISIPLDLFLEAGKTGTVFLQWRPRSVDPEAEFHVPDIEPLQQSIPPLGSQAFVTSGGSESVMVVNRQNGRVVGALRVGEKPAGLAYSRTGQILFVALAGSDAIAVVDVMSMRVINSVPLQFGDDPTRLLMSRDEATLFVLCPGSRNLVSLTAWSLQQQFRLGIGEGPRSMTQDPVSGYLYVACEDEGRVQVVDPSSGTLVTSLALLSAPVEVVIDELSRQLFLGGSAQRFVRSFNLATEVSGGDQNICGSVAGLAVNTRTRRLYASVPSCQNLAVIRPDIGIEYGSVNLPGIPGLMDFDQEFRQLWVVLPKQGAVAVCNANRGVMETLIEVDSEPFEVLVP